MTRDEVATCLILRWKKYFTRFPVVIYREVWSQVVTLRHLLRGEGGGRQTGETCTFVSFAWSVGFFHYEALRYRVFDPTAPAALRLCVVSLGRFSLVPVIGGTAALAVFLDNKVTVQATWRVLLHPLTPLGRCDSR